MHHLPEKLIKPAKSALWRALALCMPVVALLLQLALWPLIQPLALIFFYPAVFLSAWLGGLWAGIVATLISAALSEYFFLSPGHLFRLGDAHATISVLVFSSLGILVSLLREKLNRASWLALREAERRRGGERLRQIVEQSPFAIAMFDTEMRYIFASRKWLADRGLTPGSIAGRSRYETPPEVTQAWKEVHQRCLQGAAESRDEEAIPNPDGTIRWARWDCRPWYEENQEIGGLLIFIEDISERKRMAERLEESHSRLQEQQRLTELVIRNANATLWAVDATGIFTFYQGELSERFGILPSERIGKNAFEVFAHQSDIREGLKRALRGRGLKIEVNQASRWYEVTLTPSFDPQGRVIGVVGTSVDVSARKSFELELESKNRELSQGR